MKENITGHTLIEMGFRPAPWFGQALAHANREGLSGLALEKYLKQTEEAKVAVTDFKQMCISLRKVASKKTRC